jgi:hypothetical protein
MFINRSGGVRTDKIGGHIDLVLPKIGLVGFFGNQFDPNDGSGRSIGFDIPGVFKIGEEWLDQIITPREGYVLPPVDPEKTLPRFRNPISTICEIDISPSASDKMVEKAKDIDKNPGRFRIIGGNCATRASEILGAGDIMKEGISGIDNPQNLIDQLQEQYDAVCYKGYVFWNWDRRGSGLAIIQYSSSTGAKIILCYYW